jgi:polar amino acid transport system substrate-binding protein
MGPNRHSPLRPWVRCSRLTAGPRAFPQRLLGFLLMLSVSPTALADGLAPGVTNGATNGPWASLPAAPLIYLTWTVAIGLSMLLALALLRRLRRGSEDRLFDRRNFRLIGIALVGLFLALALTLANQGLGAIDQRLRQDLIETLQSVNRSAAQALQMWIEGHLRATELIAADQALIPLVHALQQAADDREHLLTAPARAQIRTLLAAKRDLADTAADVFVLALDGRALIAARADQIGRLHPLAKCNPFDLARILTSSQPLFIPPSAPNQEQPGGDCEQDELILLAAIRDERGGMLAVLGLQLRPVAALTRMTAVGQIGDTGETYVFDAEGRLMTRSRFAEQPVPGAQPGIGMRIADPGGDLTAGYTPNQAASEWPLTRMAQAALNGASGVDAEGYRDYRGVPVIGVWRWLERLGVGIATEIDQAEALAPYRALRNPVLGALFGVVLLALGLMAALIWLGERARRRLDKLVDTRTRELRKNEIERCSFHARSTVSRNA